MTDQRWPKIKALFVNNAIRLVRAVTYTVLGLIAASAVPTPEGDMAREVVSSYALVGLLALLHHFGCRFIPGINDTSAPLPAVEGLLKGLAVYGVSVWVIGYTADKIVKTVRAYPPDVAVVLVSTFAAIAAVVSVLWLVRTSRLVLSAFRPRTNAPRNVGLMTAEIANPLTPHDREVAAIHEASHALVFAALHTLPEGLEVNLFERATPSGALGNTRWSGLSDRLPFNDYMEWEMLVALAGRAGEIAATGTSTAGSNKDHAQWLALAHRYLGTHVRGIYYNEPATDYQERYNHDMREALQADQYVQLASFFAANTELHRTLIEDLDTARSMDRGTLSKYLDQAVIPEGLPKPAAFTESSRLFTSR